MPGPVKGMTIIHRDGTFEFCGQRYITATGSDRPQRDGSRYIARIRSDEPGDHEIVAEGFGYLSEVRDHIDQARRAGRRSL